MKKKNSNGIDKELLRRSKESTPEQKLDWLAAAQEFAQAATIQRSRQRSRL